MVVDGFIFENNQITLLPCFTFIPKTGIGLPKIGVSFYFESSLELQYLCGKIWVRILLNQAPDRERLFFSIFLPFKNTYFWHCKIFWGMTFCKSGLKTVKFMLKAKRVVKGTPWNWKGCSVYLQCYSFQVRAELYQSEAQGLNLISTKLNIFTKNNLCVSYLTSLLLRLTVAKPDAAHASG